MSLIPSPVELKYLITNTLLRRRRKYMHYELKHLESANFKTKRVCAIVIDAQRVDFSITNTFILNFNLS